MELEDTPMTYYDPIWPTDVSARVQMEKIDNQNSYLWSASGFSLRTIILYPVYELYC